MPDKNNKTAGVELKPDSKTDATPPETKPRKRRTRSDKGKRRAMSKAEQEVILQLEPLLILITNAIAHRLNNKSVEMVENEAQEIESGINKFIEIVNPNLLDEVPILHAVVPVLAYGGRVIVSGVEPYTVTKKPITEPRLPPPETTPRKPVTEEKPVINSIEELEGLSTVGLDESKNA